MSKSVRPYGLWPARLLCPWDSLGKNTGVGLPCPFPGDLPDPGTASLMSPPPHWQAGSLPLVPARKPWQYNYLMYLLSICSPCNRTQLETLVILWRLWLEYLFEGHMHRIICDSFKDLRLMLVSLKDPWKNSLEPSL